MNLNKVILVGRLTKEPNLRKTKGGASVSDNFICVDERQKVNGEWQSVPHFINVVFFNNTAEIVYKYLRKGDVVLVDGSLRQDKWETEDGQKRSRLEVVCNRMEMLPRNMSVGAINKDNEKETTTNDNTDVEEQAPF